MKPQMMLCDHDPKNGSWGDCHRAAIASLLELDAADVPHFYHGCDVDGGKTGEEAHAEVNRWLYDNYQLREISMIFTGDTPLVDVLSTIDNLNPGLHFILGGRSNSGCGHSVVCAGGEIIHDPSPKKSGIIGPMNDGLWWVTFLARAC